MPKRKEELSENVARKQPTWAEIGLWGSVFSIVGVPLAVALWWLSQSPGNQNNYGSGIQNNGSGKQDVRFERHEHSEPKENVKVKGALLESLNRHRDDLPSFIRSKVQGRADSLISQLAKDDRETISQAEHLITVIEASTHFKSGTWGEVRATLGSNWQSDPLSIELCARSDYESRAFGNASDYLEPLVTNKVTDSDLLGFVADFAVLARSEISGELKWPKKAISGFANYIDRHVECMRTRENPIDDRLFRLRLSAAKFRVLADANMMSQSVSMLATLADDLSTVTDDCLQRQPLSPDVADYLSANQLSATDYIDALTSLLFEAQMASGIYAAQSNDAGTRKVGRKALTALVERIGEQDTSSGNYLPKAYERLSALATDTRIAFNYAAKAKSIIESRSEKYPDALQEIVRTTWSVRCVEYFVPDDGSPPSTDTPQVAEAVRYLHAPVHQGKVDGDDAKFLATLAKKGALAVANNTLDLQEKSTFLGIAEASQAVLDR